MPFEGLFIMQRFVCVCVYTHTHIMFYLYTTRELVNKKLHIFFVCVCGFIIIIAVDSNSQTLQPITLELRRRKISKGNEVPLKRPRLDKNSCESSVCVCVAGT